MKKTYLILPILAGIMFGATGPFVRTFTENGFDTTTLLFARFSISIFLVMITILLTDKSLFKINLKSLPLLVICGICVVGLNLCYNVAINTIPLSIAATLLSTAAIFVLIFAYIVFREKITSKKLICVGLAIIGCILMTGAFEVNISGYSVIGIIFGIGAALFWAAYLIVSKRAIETGNHPYTILFYSVIVISIILLPFTDFNHISTFMTSDLTFAILLLIAHSLISFTLPYILTTISLNHIDSGIVSIIMSCVEPSSALIFGLILYNEIPTGLMFIGFVLTMLAIVMLSKIDMDSENELNEMA